MHNSQYETGSIEYVRDAYITAPFATADNTGNEGSFTLVFVGMESGTTVRVQAEKAGLEVVNTHDLERVVIGRRDPLPIYLAEKGVLAQAQTELYNISKQALYAQRDALIARLRSEGEQRTQAMAELQQRLGREVADRFEAEDLLNERIVALEKRLPSFAQALAAQNLDFASDLYINAYERYKAGDIEGAVALLDSTALVTSYQEAVEAIVEGKRLDSIGIDLKLKGRRQLRQTIDSYALKAEGLALLFSYGEAAQQYGRIVAIYRENDLDSLELARWYDKLGNTLKDNGKYARAMEAHQGALTIREGALDLKYPDLFTSYSYVAFVHYYLGEYKKALEYYQRAITIAKDVLDPDHPDLAASYNGIAMVYNSLGEYQKALEYVQRAIAIDEEVLGPKHPYLAYPYNNIAVIYKYLGEYRKALEYSQKALAVREEVLGPKHLSLATSCSNVASLYLYLGEYQKALSYNQRALTIFEEVLDPGHPNLATPYNNIAVTYEYLGEYQRALEYHRRAIAILKEVLSPKHPDLATSFNNVAIAYEYLGEYQRALEYHRRAIAIREEVLGPKHPYLVASYNNIAMVYHSMGSTRRLWSTNRGSLRSLRRYWTPSIPTWPSPITILPTPIDP